ncbi:hypothetical protein PACTADRAFT_47661 [Pachysolen tannophilus NRRL Y-2460]|uniref:Protein transport protein BOS1 n=1 Tax=Pachysolen tannophilus NRRL Y-2460 TaxID=669874 RepID=A0A1E4U1D6_PACTA|nr:hypothetical protein PACTADRAFT_47661 [Pachysolen tannophilus NRRL Y-2460]
MNSIYNHAVKQTQSLKRDLESFEANITNSPLSLIGQISTTLTQLAKTIDEYSISLNKQQRQSSSSVSKEQEKENETKFLKNENKLNNLNNQLDEFKLQFNRLKKFREEHLQEQSRTQLFERTRHGHNGSFANSASDNPYINNSPPTDQQQQAQLGYEEGLYREKHTLQTGNQQLDHLLEMASGSLDNLVEQNDYLRNMSRKISSSVGTLKISNVTLKKIERKCKEDKLFFVGGCVVTFFCFYLILRFFG